MDSLPEDNMLKFHPDTLEAVRKEINLEHAPRMEESLEILQSWLMKQMHFCKKDFSRDYLERTLVTCKGQVERAKQRLEKLFTFRTLHPEFFEIPTDNKHAFDNLEKILLAAHMPQLTPEHYRVYVAKIAPENFEASAISDYFKYLVTLCEYFKRSEYCNGFVIIVDYRELSNIMNFVTKINPIQMRNCISLMTDGYGLRIKSIHIIIESVMVDTILKMFKFVFSTKLINRIHTHKSIETVYDAFVPKEILPADYGGNEKTLKEMNREWVTAVTSEEFKEYLKEMNKAKTNVSNIQEDNNNNYENIPGSFRFLSVD